MGCDVKEVQGASMGKNVVDENPKLVKQMLYLADEFPRAFRSVQDSIEASNQEFQKKLNAEKQMLEIARIVLKNQGLPAEQAAKVGAFIEECVKSHCEVKVEESMKCLQPTREVEFTSLGNENRRLRLEVVTDKKFDNNHDTAVIIER